MPARQQSDRRGLSDGGDRDDRIEARDQACNACSDACIEGQRQEQQQQQQQQYHHEHDEIINYGLSNKTGTMLARELLAREIEARELLAWEMGSQTRATFRSRRSYRSLSRRSYPGIIGTAGDSVSCNASLDCGSTILSRRSRWDLSDPAATFILPQHQQQPQENYSLPANFLYFKFEQMLTRWVQQKAMTTALSLDHRLRPILSPRSLMNLNSGTRRSPSFDGPPRLITTVSSDEMVDGTAKVFSNSKNGEASATSDVPTTKMTTKAAETVTNVTTSPAKSKPASRGVNTSPAATPASRESKLPRFMQPTTTFVNHTSPTNQSRSRTPSKIVTRNQSTLAQRRPCPSPVRNTKRVASTRGRSASPHVLTNTQGVNKNTRKRASSLRPNQEQQRNVEEETRSPVETREYTEESHYFKRDDDSATIRPDLEYESRHQRTKTDELPPLPLRCTNNDQNSPTLDAHPHPDEDQCATPSIRRPLQGTSSLYEQLREHEEQLNLDLPPTSSARTSLARPSPKSKRGKAENSPQTKGNKITKTQSKKGSPATKTSTKKPSPTKETPEPASNSKRRRSRLPPLPSFRNSISPSLQEKHDRKQTAATPKGKRKGTIKPPNPKTKGKDSNAVSKRHLTKPEAPCFVQRYRRQHIRATNRIQQFVRVVLARKRFLRFKAAVSVLQSLHRRNKQLQAYRQAINATRFQRFACIVIQKNVRMISSRSSFLRLQHAVVMAQAAIRMFVCRSVYVELQWASKKLLSRVGPREAPSAPKPQTAMIKGGRLRIYSALLIQSLGRMRWVRAAFLELRKSTIVIQIWFRKVHKVIKKQNAAAIVIQNWAQSLSWRACFLDLRQSVILLQKWLRVCLVQLKYQREIQHDLEDFSATLIQSLRRRAICRSAYEQLRSTAVTLQQWARSRIIRMEFQRLCYASLVLQCWTRQKISDRRVFELSRIIVVQAMIRSQRTNRDYRTQRTCAVMIQACVRGYLYRTGYLSLGLAALVVQTRFRGKQAKAYVSVQQSIHCIEVIKQQKRSKLNDGVDQLTPDSQFACNSAVVATCDGNKAALLGAPQPGDTLPRSKVSSGHNVDLLAAALAFVSHSPGSKRKSTTRRPRQAATPVANAEQFFPIEFSNEINNFYRDAPVHDMLGAALQKASKPAAPRDPCGENLSRSPSKVMTQNDVHLESDISSNRNMSPISPSRHPKASSCRKLLKGNPTKYADAFPALSKISSPSLSNSSCSEGGGEIATHSLTSYDSTQVPKMNTLQPLNKLPHDPYFLLAARPTSDQLEYPVQEEPISSIELATPAKISTLSSDNISSGYLPSQAVETQYVSKHSATVPSEANSYNGLKEIEAQSCLIVNPLKRIIHSRLDDESYLPKAKKEDEDVSERLTGKANSGRKFSRSRRLQRFAKRAMLKRNKVSRRDTRNEEDEEENTMTIVTKSIKTESVDVTRKVEKIKESNSSKSSHCEQNEESSQPAQPNVKVDSSSTSTNKYEVKDIQVSHSLSKETPAEDSSKASDINVEPLILQWTNGEDSFVGPDIGMVTLNQHETRSYNEASILTSGLEGESTTQIQSAWRSHRDQLHLAALLLKTWNVSCSFSPGISESIENIWQNATIFALDSAIKQIGYTWQDCSMLVKKGLTMMQWEGTIEIRSLVVGPSAEYTRCIVRVHCTANESDLLKAWTKDRRRSLLVKAALTRHMDDQGQKPGNLISVEDLPARMPKPSANMNSLLDLDASVDDTESVSSTIEKNPWSKDPCIDPNCSFDSQESSNPTEKYINSVHSATAGDNPWAEDPCIEQGASSDDQETLDDGGVELTNGVSFVATMTVASDDVSWGFQERLSMKSAILIQSWFRMRVYRRMYLGLSRIQARVLLTNVEDGAESESAKLYNFLARQKCETILEEKEGFEVSSSCSDGA